MTSACDFDGGDCLIDSWHNVLLHEVSALDSDGVEVTQTSFPGVLTSVRVVGVRPRTLTKPCLTHPAQVTVSSRAPSTNQLSHRRPSLMCLHGAIRRQRTPQDLR
jgi:hypothetical protein